MIDVAKILDRLGISYEDIGDDYRTECWFHEEGHPSMSIHKEGGYYHCFSCNRKGNVFTMLKDFLGKTGIEALQYLSSFDTQAESEEEEEKLADAMQEKFESRSTYKLPVRIILFLLTLTSPL